MTTRNELRRAITHALAKSGMLDDQSSLGYGSNGDLYIRLRDQVFTIDVKEVDAISEHPNAMEEAERFMQTLPHPVAKV